MPRFCSIAFLCLCGTAIPLKVLAIDNVQELLRSMRAARHEIESGHFVAKGRFTDAGDLVPLNLEVWFESRTWRVDVGMASRSREVSDSGHLCVIQHGKSAVVHAEGATSVVDERQAIVAAHYFDVRALGLADSFDMRRAASIDQILETYQSSGVPMRLDRQANGLLQLTRGPLAGGGKQVITVDPYRGFVPLEARLFVGPANEQLIQSTWTRVDGVWVPTRLQNRSRGRLKTELSLDWKSVNRKLDPNVFDPEFVMHTSVKR